MPDSRRHPKKHASKSRSNKWNIAGGLQLAAVVLPSCATTHAVRWTYGMSSIYDKPDEFSEREGLRPVVGVPLILGSAAMDAVTWPFQLLFGVWPMWGSASQHMKPTSGPG